MSHNLLFHLGRRRATWWKHVFTFATMLLLCVGTYAQTTVTGKVSSNTGDGLAGATIQVRGTQTGTFTDGDGKYSITVPSEDAILVFTMLGYDKREVPVAGRSNIDISLQGVGLTTDEVVITALGIEREAKSLTYAAQTVNTDELSQARELNVVNSLSGKVAGLSIARSGGGVGAASRVILRGERSIAGNSEPLYVVDGVPIIGDITDINPDDIASISVLKGPNAAALYGNRANNGAIIINTKKGSAGDFKITVSSTYMAESPILLVNYQNDYGQGNAGSFNPASEQSWGPKFDGSQQAHWSPDPDLQGQTLPYSAQPDNVTDFFQTGHNWATSVAISGGTEKSQTYFSYTHTDAAGVVPTNELKRHNVNLRITNKLANKLTLDTKLNYVREDINNEMRQGEGFLNPIRHVFRLPRNIRTQDVSNFEYIDAENRNRQNFWNPGSNGGANPYWNINRNLNQNDVDRVIAFASLRYDILDGLFVQLRSSYDRINRQYEQKDYVDTYIQADNGRFSLRRSDGFELNNDILVSYNKNVTDDLFISVNAGANARSERNSALSSNTGNGLTVPNQFALANTQLANTSFNVGSPRDVNSVYGFAQATWKGLTLDLTARNDWSSTLPQANWSFFYPSVGLSLVLGDMIDLPSFVTMAKLRGSWAEVGNDTGPYQTLRTATVRAGGTNGFLAVSSTIPNENLLPEETQSIELGADLRFFDNRVGLDFTYYKTNSKNQLFSVTLPIGSGASQFFTNGGDVENKGIEAILSLRPIQTQDFQWDIQFNYTRNRSLVVAINDERPSIVVSGGFLREFRIEQGEPWGNIYSRGFLRDDQGRVVIDANSGLPKITNGITALVGNYNPDWLGGIRNAFYYKDLSVSFLVDIRQGGQNVSFTNAILYSDGTTEETLQGRDGGLIFGQNFFENETAVLEDGSANNVSFTSENFWRNFGGRNAPVGEAFVVDASNVRLRELVIGYRLPIEAGVVNSVRLSLVGRNLFFISNKAGNLDPEVFAGTGKGTIGTEQFAPPTQRSIGGSISVDF